VVGVVGVAGGVIGVGFDSGPQATSRDNRKIAIRTMDSFFIFQTSLTTWVYRHPLM
jgi:hypothetical protein